MTKKNGFTLAEVLITLGIIGIVAMLTLPQLIKNIEERMNSYKHANVVQKVTKSVELMVVSGDYKDIYTTEDFINALSKHLNISKVCNSENITDCWPSKTIKTANGSAYDISNAKTSKDLYVRGGDDTPNVGLVLADGTSLIMTFNPNASAVSADSGFMATTKNLPIGGGKYKDFAYSSNATVAIDFVMDVNGADGPNQEADLNGNYYDIRSFKTATFTPGACPGGVKAANYCLTELGMDYEAYDCVNKPKGNTYCLMGYLENYWAGANMACTEIGMKLPSRTELSNIAGLGLTGFNFSQYITSDTRFIAAINGYGHATYSNETVYDNIQKSVLCVQNF